MTQGVHDTAFNFITEFRQTMHELEDSKWRVEIYMTDGNRYWVKAIIEEWEDAIRIVPENGDKPLYLMKHTIQSMTPVRRPVESHR